MPATAAAVDGDALAATGDVELPGGDCSSGLAVGVRPWLAEARRGETCAASGVETGGDTGLA